MLAFITLAGLMVWAFSGMGNDRVDKPSAISCTREWARLESFPKSAQNLKVIVEGSMFTREFVIAFDAPKKDIDEWLMKSPGTKGVKPQIQADGSLFYGIKPGGGAQYAEVVISNKGRHARIRTYWS